MRGLSGASFSTGSISGVRERLLHSQVTNKLFVPKERKQITQDLILIRRCFVIVGSESFVVSEATVLVFYLKRNILVFFF